MSGNNAVRTVYVNPGITFNLNSMTIANSAASGIYNRGGTVTVSNSTFASNSAGPGGAGIFNDNGIVTVSYSTFSANSASRGGGIFNDNGGRLTVSHSIFSGNSASAAGGGLFNDNGSTLTVSNSTLSGNSASASGGGIYNDNSSTLTVSNSTFSGNSANASGGGIFNENDSTIVMSNCTFSGNNASVGGGGIFNDTHGTVTVSNSTFSGNSAYWAGAIRNIDGTVTLKNTLVANSLAIGNCSGVINGGGGNLSYPDATCPGINGDPRLGVLRDNGGPTATMALAPGSAALDMANDAICSAPPVNSHDQRGVIRPQGAHCDIGAYEAAPGSLTKAAFLPIIVR
ncbi:choice-of-anchor Q domain-containing protein [Candidatus Amarolinea dominans]|uniref:choice-of-anchor Q domain-containing protein n=1 Tax=Candidatus Amarolinea dominans TaxID=3140696 RepID=UPI003134B76A|nr:right-handed parallel beta-helix repeat-containing protein [Anaerolineae bacterium]